MAKKQPSKRKEGLRHAKYKAQERQAVQRFPIQPPTLMPGVVPQGERPAVAMDYASGVYDYAQQMVAMSAGVFDGFPGYPYLASLMTRAEYRTFADTLSKEMTREWIEFRSVAEDADVEDNPRIKELEGALKDFDLRNVFREAIRQDTFFGRGQISINIRGADESTPLILSPHNVGIGRVESFTTIEAMWTTPSAYNALDPTAPDFYRPRQWWVLGRTYHASRLLTIISRPLPDMLKPAFNFSGMSLSQLAEPYVNNWLRTRQSVSDLINNFSITALATSMDQVLEGGDGNDLFDRADLFTATRSNRGLMLLDKDREEIIQINTPLSGLHELQAQAQEHLCSVSRIPSMLYTGISPTGMNASSEGEIRAFYDWIKSEQEAHIAKPLDQCIKVVMLHLWGEIDDSITWRFRPLWQIDPVEESTVRLNNANADAIYLDRQVVSQEECRKKLATDPDSGWRGLDVDDVPMTEDLFDEEAQNDPNNPA